MGSQTLETGLGSSPPSCHETQPGNRVGKDDLFQGQLYSVNKTALLKRVEEEVRKAGSGVLLEIFR